MYCKTVVITTKNGSVIINESDFNTTLHTLDVSLEELAVTAELAAAAPGATAAMKGKATKARKAADKVK